MSNEPAKKAITILNKSSTGRLVSSREFITVRDFLIVQLELENTQRPGPMPQYPTSERLNGVITTAKPCTVRNTNDPLTAQHEFA